MTTIARLYAVIDTMTKKHRELTTDYASFQHQYDRSNTTTLEGRYDRLNLRETLRGINEQQGSLIVQQDSIRDAIEVINQFLPDDPYSYPEE